MDKETFNSILQDIEDGKTVRYSIKKHNISSRTFYEYIDANPLEEKQYARSLLLNNEIMADEIIDISDEPVPMTERGFDGAAVAQNRLRVDSRKWLLSKRMPKKYGDKLDVTSAGEKVESIQWQVIPCKKTNDPQT